MTKLSDTQLTILSAAAQRPDGNLLPLPGSLRGGAAGKVVGALLGRGLVREEVTDSTRPADAAFNTIWRNEEDGRPVLLRWTRALPCSRGRGPGRRTRSGSRRTAGKMELVKNPLTGALAWIARQGVPSQQL